MVMAPLLSQNRIVGVEDLDALREMVRGQILVQGLGIGKLISVSGCNPRAMGV
jgi:hypothetical protein